VVTERGLALGPVAGHQPGHPDLGHPIGPGYLPLGPALSDDSGDDQTPSISPDSAGRGYSYVLRHAIRMS